jgi:hypothetical protein
MLKKENIRKEKALERESFPEVIHPAPRFNVLNRLSSAWGGVGGPPLHNSTNPGKFCPPSFTPFQVSKLSYAYLCSHDRFCTMYICRNKHLSLILYNIASYYPLFPFSLIANCLAHYPLLLPFLKPSLIQPHPFSKLSRLLTPSITFFQLSLIVSTVSNIPIITFPTCFLYMYHPLPFPFSLSLAYYSVFFIFSPEVTVSQ